MVLPLAGRFDHLVDDVGRRRLVRIPHAEIDDVLTTLPGFELERLHLREDIRGESFDSIKPVAQPHDCSLARLIDANRCSRSPFPITAVQGTFDTGLL